MLGIGLPGAQERARQSVAPRTCCLPGPRPTNREDAGSAEQAAHQRDRSRQVRAIGAGEAGGDRYGEVLCARLTALGEQPQAVAGVGDQLAPPVTGIRDAADESAIGEGVDRDGVTKILRGEA